MSDKTNCLLVHPEFSKHSSLNYVDVCKIAGAKYPIPPLGLMTVAALLPQNWNFKLIDLNTTPLLDKYFDWADIVCTGGMLSQQPGIIAIIRKAHEFGKKVLAGGPDPTCQPDLYAEADYLVMGEGENTIPLFLDDLNMGVARGRYITRDPVDMTSSVVPRYDLIRFSDYLMMGMQYSRGCPYNCEFCNVIEIFGRNQRTKTTVQIITEFQYLKNLGYRGHIFFVDDNFLANGKAVEELLISIAEWSEKNSYPFYFQAEASLNFAGNDKFLQLMKKAEFRYLSIGLETPDNTVLEKAQKHQNMNQSIPAIIRKILSYGIIVDASFIFGFDNDSEQSARLMMDCIRDSGICMAMVGTLYALPDTQLARRLKNEGRLFQEVTKINVPSREIDQMTSGLNFQTIRPKSAILKDYASILNNIYDPENYYKRLTYLGLNLKPCYRHKPANSKKISLLRSFLKVCGKVGFNSRTGILFWKLLFTILFKNPRALESVVGFAAMYIHLEKHARFIIDLTNAKIKDIMQVENKISNYPDAAGNNNRLKILVCKPRLAIQTIRLNRFIRCEPLEMEYLYTVLQHHDIYLLDGVVDRRNPVRLASKLKIQVVLFTSLITTVSVVLKTASRLKKLANPPLIFVGGPDAEVVPGHFFSKDIDGVFFANQLEGISLVIDRIMQSKPYHDIPGGAFPVDGKFIRNPSFPLDLEKMPRPKHFLLEQNPDRYKIIYYKPCAAIKTAFGCSGKCTFCFSTEMNGGAYGARPIHDVVDEIEEISVQNILILDDNFFASRKRMLEFCELIEKRKIKKEFIAIGNARFIVQNPDIMAQLRDAGVKAVMVGFEFVTDGELAAIDKDSSVDDNNRTIEICRELDIDLFALFIVDPAWRHADFKRLAGYIKKNKIPFALFSTLTVFPGTKLARLHPEPSPDMLKSWRFDLLRLHQKPAHMSVIMYYLWLFYLYMIPGMQFTSIRKFRQRYGVTGIIRHAVTGFFMGWEYLIKLLIWR